MRFSVLVASALAALSPATASLIDKWDFLAGKALVNQVSYHFSNPEASLSCTPLTATVRREWGSLSKHERRKYIEAVQCLISKPSQSDPDFAPGARTRFDDFVAVHINQTMYIHMTGNFLTWHRYFTWAYERALREECGYKGSQPYWAWNKYAADPLNSPIFDGSDTSMSGDGAYVPHNGPQVLQGLTLPPANGGGCVKEGPFKNFTVNLGPVLPSLNVTKGQNGTGLNYNPRCLRRDISKYSANWTTTEIISDLILDHDNIWTFQNRLQGDAATGYVGIHSGGHYTIGGDPGGDLYTSPGDPAFYLHHSAIDRVFWTWQNLDPRNRTYVVKGPSILPGFGDPTGNDTTLDTVVDMPTLAPRRTIRELLDTTGGPFCYVYL
ncbi:tyrosinase family protein [Aspergillus affinis]|uniref:tyrosinase family protein n=1 Tax=Aspergillus affinis TaxID=1070780 RepID=UPI0022FF1C7B|nr:putative tyrosinase [Aspergillus affinis]KAI9036121.1 putative tyrosinase [Aspergillus affinis]